MKRAIVKSMTETTAWRSHCQFITFITFLFTVNVIRQMAPLFSNVDLHKLWQDVQNEETLICAKFGKDLFNISKVIGRKKWPSFFDSQCSCEFNTHRRRNSTRQLSCVGLGGVYWALGTDAETLRTFSPHCRAHMCLT